MLHMHPIHTSPIHSCTRTCAWDLCRFEAAKGWLGGPVTERLDGWQTKVRGTVENAVRCKSWWVGARHPSPVGLVVVGCQGLHIR